MSAAGNIDVSIEHKRSDPAERDGAGHPNTCPGCGSHYRDDELALALYVCGHCGHHYSMPARARIDWLADPGSFVEEKDFALVWHYRMADPVFGEWLANELCANLEELLAETELRAIRGQKSVEIRLVWANKGELVARVEAGLPAVDFRLAVGDDRTDEDLFERLPQDAWTVHVGQGTSHARFCLSGPREVVAVLDELARVAS